MSIVLYERDGRIARITLNRPEVMNAIDDVPRELSEAVARADGYQSGNRGNRHYEHTAPRHDF